MSREIEEHLRVVQHQRLTAMQEGIRGISIDSESKTSYKLHKIIDTPYEIDNTTGESTTGLEANKIKYTLPPFPPSET